MRTTKKNPDPSEELLEHLAIRPDRYVPASEELDRITAGTMTDDEFVDVAAERHSWFSDFLPSLNWFMELSDLALEGRNPGSDDFEFGPNPLFAGQRKELSRLLTDVLMAFGPAHQEGSPYSADWLFNGIATRELLKRYRLYTRYVESFVLEVWPTLDRDLLLNPVFASQK